MVPMKYGLYALLVTTATAVFCLAYITAFFNFSQATAIEKLSSDGWTFGRIPDGKLTWTQIALLDLFPIAYFPLVNSAKAPAKFSSGTLSSSISDLKCIERLEIVILNGGILNANDVQAIGELPNCAQLDLRFCEYDDSLQYLGQSIGKLKQLRTLKLSSRGLSGCFLRSINVLKDLQVCEISGLTLEASDLEHLVSFPEMRIVDISFTNFDAETLSETTKSRITIQSDGFREKIAVRNAGIPRSRDEVFEELSVGGY